jgi:hypothetical protein
MVGELEYQKPNGHMHTTYPSWFKPNTIRYSKNAADIFNEAFAISSTGDFDYASSHKTIYLPMHDGNAGNRLQHKSFLFGQG